MVRSRFLKWPRTSKLQHMIHISSPHRSFRSISDKQALITRCGYTLVSLSIVLSLCHVSTVNVCSARGPASFLIGETSKLLREVRFRSTATPSSHGFARVGHQAFRRRGAPPANCSSGSGATLGLATPHMHSFLKKSNDPLSYFQQLVYNCFNI